MSQFLVYPIRTTKNATRLKLTHLTKKRKSSTPTGVTKLTTVTTTMDNICQISIDSTSRFSIGLPLNYDPDVLFIDLTNTVSFIFAFLYMSQNNKLKTNLF